MVEALSIWARGNSPQWVTQFNVSHSLNGQAFDWIIDPLDYYHGSVRQSSVARLQDFVIIEAHDYT